MSTAQKLYLQKANLKSCFNRTSAKEFRYPIFEDDEKKCSERRILRFS